MSFINAQATTVIRAKLTDAGRKLLSQGSLSYNYWVFGDSEIDYRFYNDSYNLNNNIILSPKDKNYNIKYPIPSVFNGDIFNTLDAVISQEKVIVNIATPRGFFNGLNVKPDLLKGVGTISSSDIDGGYVMNVAISSGNISLGDILILEAKNASSSSTAGTAVPILTYKVQALNGSTGTVSVTVDRELPTINGGGLSCHVYIIKGGDAISNYYGSGTTTSYWNSNTLSFENNCNCIPDDVPVWNFNIIYTENIAGIDLTTYKGIDTFQSKIYNGFKEYLNYSSADPSRKSLGIVHYSNNTISNYYGENFKTGTFKLTLPTVLWHKQGIASGTGSVSGLVLTAQPTTSAVTSNSSAFGTASIPFNAPYDNLIDQNGFVVGKVFNALKIAVIEDEELITAMSYKSNRNWTLPTLVGNFVSALSEGQGLIGQNEEVYVTYLLANEGDTGYKTGLQCQNYKKISRGGLTQNNIKVNLPLNELPFLKETPDINGGFNANKVYLLVQKVTVGNRPQPNAWKRIDVTSQIPTSTSGRVNPVFFENTSFTVDLASYNGAIAYNLHTYLNVPTIAENDLLNFGDEYVLFGNVETNITATTYKSSFVFPATSNQFKTTVNPTYSSNVNDSLFISEVGIYNSLKQLVAIGKLSRPIQKKSTSTVLVQLEIDF